MKYDKINFVKLLKNYKSGWVGISADHKKVVAWGKTLKQVREKSTKIQDRIYFFPSGESYGNFAGYAAI